MMSLLDKILYRLSCDQVKILLDRMDTHPEMFSTSRNGVWDSHEMTWMQVAMHGTYRPHERWAIDRKLHRLALKYSRERILDVLLDTDNLKCKP